MPTFESSSARDRRELYECPDLRSNRHGGPRRSQGMSPRPRRPSCPDSRANAHRSETPQVARDCPLGSAGLYRNRKCSSRLRRLLLLSWRVVNRDVGIRVRTRNLPRHDDCGANSVSTKSRYDIHLRFRRRNGQLGKRPNHVGARKRCMERVPRLPPTASSTVSPSQCFPCSAAFFPATS